MLSLWSLCVKIEGGNAHIEAIGVFRFLETVKMGVKMEKADYIFKTVTLIEWQKWFNQWKHNYTWEILYISTQGESATILMKRESL